MSAQLIALKQLATGAYQQLGEKYPQVATVHSSPLGLDSVQNTIAHTLGQKHQDDSTVITSLTQEENA